MPRPVSVPTPARNASQRPNLAATVGLTVIPGGRNRPEMILVARSAVEEMHAELLVSRKERVTYAVLVRQASRAVQRAIAAGRLSLAATWADQLERASVREQDRAFAADTGPCPCGCQGSGHGPATDDALDVPLERVA